jgi:hypothetical protein
MPYTAQFFAEKLQVPVEYFNPFRNLQIDPAVNLEELSRVAHSLGEVVGLGLRNLANCPVEMNLMPDSTLRWRAFNEKKPYFMATVYSLVLVAFAVGFMFQQLARSKQDEIDRLQPELAKIQDKVNRLKSVYGRFQDTQSGVDQVTTWMEERHYWNDLLDEMRRGLIRAEDGIQKKYAVQKPGLQTDIWIEQMTVGTPAAAAPADSGAAASTASAANAITLLMRAVDLTSVDTAANNEVVYAVEREFKAAPVFDPKTVQSSAQISAVDANGTFSFSFTVAPQNQLKL